MNSLDRLNVSSLPPRDAFDNWLTNSGISEDDYNFCHRMWREKGMRTFKDFLVWYNNLDVEPMLEALKKQSEVYEEKGIDMLKEAISLPGLAVLWKFTYTDNKAQQGLQLLQRADDDLYPLIKNNIVGGPSIVFHRYHEKDETSIRGVDYGVNARSCKKILGVDANALYLYCMMRPLPEGPPRRYRPNESGEFIETIRMGNSKTAFGWLAWLQRSMFDDHRIQHAGNGQEVRVGERQLPVDGFCSAINTVYQFHGCFWHKHPCDIGKCHTQTREDRERYEETLRNDRYIRALGYRLVSVWECEWQKTVNDAPKIKGFLQRFFDEYYPRKRSLDKNSMISEIRDGKFFGLIECDIRVPDDRLDYFSEMSPIFKHAEVGREHVGKRLQELLIAQKVLSRPRASLIGSMFGKRILLFSELLKWYLDHGLILDEIYQAIQFRPNATFKRFGDSVSDARRQGDVDPSKQLLADTNKLIGNSSYGKLITNKDKHRKISYLIGHSEISTKLSRASFDSLEELDDDGLYELSEYKRHVSLSFIIKISRQNYFSTRNPSRAHKCLANSFRPLFFCRLPWTVQRT